MPDFTITGLQFTKGENNHCIIEKDSCQIKFEDGSVANISNVFVDFNAETKAVNVKYGVQYGTMPLTLTYDFKSLTTTEFVCGDFVGVCSSKMVETDYSSNIVIMPQENGKYSIAFPVAAKEIIGSRMAEPKYTLTDVEIKADGNVFTFEVAEKNFEGLDVEKNEPINILLTKLVGKVENNHLTMSYTMQPGSMPFCIPYNYDGFKMSK